MNQDQSKSFETMSDDELLRIAYSFYEDHDNATVRRSREILMERGVVIDEYRIKRLRDEKTGSLKGTEDDYKKMVEGLKTSLETAKSMHPPVKSAYSPSGKISMPARLVMLTMFPLSVALFIVLSSVFIDLYNMLGRAIVEKINIGPDGMDAFADIWGYVTLGANLLIVLGISIGISALYAKTGKKLRSRNLRFTSSISTLAVAVTAAVMYLPIFGGKSLAPTDYGLSFFGVVEIPLKWVLIVAGIVCSPLIAFFVTRYFIFGQKFCEETGIYLKKRPPVCFPYYALGDVKAALSEKKFDEIGTIPRALELEISRKHYCLLELWCDENAVNACVDVYVHFHRVIDNFIINISKDVKEDDVRASWLTLSMITSREDAEIILNKLN